jgi:hypothetical protein
MSNGSGKLRLELLHKSMPQRIRLAEVLVSRKGLRNH